MDTVSGLSAVLLLGDDANAALVGTVHSVDAFPLGKLGFDLLDLFFRHGVAQLIHQQSEISVTLEKSLGDSERKLLSQYTESRADLETLFYCHYFKKGFLMGVTFTERMHP